MSHGRCRGRAARAVAAGACAALALAAAAGASADPARRRYAFRHFGDEQGLANLTVTALTQDRAGFLWVGTQDGLYRFDGQRFARFGRPEGLPSGLVDAVFEAPDGSLWVGTDQGLALREGERFRAYGPADGMSGEPVYSIASDAAGRVWVAEREGLKRLSSGRFETVALAGWPGGRVLAIAPDPDGSLWLAGTGHVGRLEGRALAVLGAEAGLPADRFEALLVDRGGGLWVRSGARLLQLPAGARRFVDRSAGLPPNNAYATLYLDRSGDLWVPTDFGLARLTPEGGWEIVGQQRGLTSDAVLAVFEDREGLLWVGLAGTGLDCWLGYPSWTAYTTSEGLNNDAVWSVVRDPAGALWVGTDKGLNRLDPRSRSWRAWGKSEGLGGECAYVLLVDPSGSVWVGLFPGGVSRLDRSGRIETFGHSDGLRGDRVSGLALTPDGALWVATDHGLYRARGTAGRPRFESVTLPGGTATETFWSLLVDGEGRLWAAGHRGLGVLEKGQWRRLTTRDGLRSGEVLTVAQGIGASIWVSYWEPMGATRLELRGHDVHVDHLDQHAGLAADAVEAIAADASGRTWIGTSRGLNVLESGRLRHYGRADGLIWESVNDLYPDADGGLWIATNKGLAHYEPRPAQPLPPPSVVLLEARLGNHPLALDASADVPYADRTFAVAFAGLTFRKPEQVRFRYRLAGLEEGFTETALREARYPKLPAGRYAFEVLCRNDEGTWSRAPARFSFRIRPPWYATPAALAGAGALGVLAVGLAYRLRVRNLIRARERLEAAVAERTRELEQQKRMVEEQSHALVAAAEERRRVYAMVVHDLKNPLTPLLGGLDFLAEGLRPDFAAGQQAIQTMRHAARRMLFLIDSYTSTLRATSPEGELRWRGFAALDLVSDLALSYAPATRKRGLQLLVNDVPVDDRWFPERGGVIADAPAEPVYRALENILGNALKYASSTIRLGVEQSDGRVGLVVENDGVPIPDADKQRIFGIYQQADRARPGTGVGLASARRHVEEVGGEIRVADPVRGQGARFEVWLPALAQAEG